MSGSGEDRIDLPFMPFYVRDFLRSRFVRGSSPAEVGIYVLLLCEQWENGPLPEDTDRMASLIGVDREAMATAWERLKRRFQRTNDGYENPRLAAVRSEQESKVQRRKRAGKAGAKARWSKGKDGNRNATANADAMEDTESDTDTEVEKEKGSYGPQKERDNVRLLVVRECWETWKELNADWWAVDQMKLTRQRREKLNALYEEQLAPRADDYPPVRLFEAIIRAAREHEWWGTDRTKLRPTTLFRSSEKREERTLDALERLEGSGPRSPLPHEKVLTD